jgi:hypothetical protein
MSEYWYPDGAVKSQDELAGLVKRARRKPIKVWLVRPQSSYSGPNPLALTLNKKTELSLRFECPNEYTINLDELIFWSPNGESCFPYGAIPNGTDPEWLGYFFTNYWMAVGWALRSNVFSQANDE